MQNEFENSPISHLGTGLRRSRVGTAVRRSASGLPVGGATVWTLSVRGSAHAGAFYIPYLKARCSVSQGKNPSRLIRWTTRCQLHFRSIVGSLNAARVSI